MRVRRKQVQRLMMARSRYSRTADTPTSHVASALSREARRFLGESRSSGRSGPLLAAALATVLVLLGGRGALAQQVVVSRQLSAASLENFANSRQVSAQLEKPVRFSRPISVENREDLGVPFSRPLSVVSEQVPNAASAQVGVISSPFALLTSSGVGSDSGRVLQVSGTLPQQLTALNSGPPAFTPTWDFVERRLDNHNPTEFECAAVTDPLAFGFVSANRYLAGVHEVTLDNCASAFYRFSFSLPARAARISLHGSANVDDQGVAFVNGNRISGLMTVPACNPAGPADPCYALQDTRKDRTDAAGLPVLTAPTFDRLETDVNAFFQPGENAIVFGVCGDASPREPTGVEFGAYLLFQLLGDMNCDGAVDFNDIDGFVAALVGPAAYAAQFPWCLVLNADGDRSGQVDFNDIDDFIGLLISG